MIIVGICCLSLFLLHVCCERLRGTPGPSQGKVTSSLRQRRHRSYLRKQVTDRAVTDVSGETERENIKSVTKLVIVRSRGVAVINIVLYFF